jgi:DNA-binding NarL/FixJ family response regulator
MSATITVLIVDDQALIRGAVRELVAHESDMTVVGEAANGRSAVAEARELKPDVILMDIRMPEIDGIQATREIFALPELSGTRILILTTFEEDSYVAEALRAGASGFVGKATDPKDLMHAIRTIHAGDALLSPRATRSLIDRYVGARQSTNALAPRQSEVDLSDLTEREQEILVLVAEGWSNTEIADQLAISPLTAKTHVNRTMAKLRAHDRAQLVIIAYEAGLVIPRAR